MDDKDERRNPYAAPKVARRVRSDEDAPRRTANFESQRQSVLVTVLLGIFTIGIYQWIWWFLRRRFLDGLDASEKLGFGLPSATIALNVLSQLVPLMGKEFAPLASILLIGATVLHLVVVFRIAGILRSHFARNGIRREVSGLATFFLGVMYLQYIINQGADVELTIPSEDRPRRKKKKKRPVPADPEVDASADA